KNVRLFFVNNMADAISQEILHYVEPSVTAIRTATNAQSIVLNFLYQQAIIETLAADPDRQNGDYLTQNQINEIQEKMMKYAPYFSSGGQEYYLSGSEVNEFARQMDGKA